jgi:hypothetical protein
MQQSSHSSQLSPNPDAKHLGATGTVGASATTTVTEAGIPPPQDELANARWGFSRCRYGQCRAAPMTLILQYRQRSTWSKPALYRIGLCADHAAQWCRLWGVRRAEIPTIDFWDPRRPDQPTVLWPEEWIPALTVAPKSPA